MLLFIYQEGCQQSTKISLVLPLGPLPNLWILQKTVQLSENWDSVVVVVCILQLCDSETNVNVFAVRYIISVFFYLL